jgi:IMP cyclohydrolase
VSVETDGVDATKHETLTRMETDCQHALTHIDDKIALGVQVKEALEHYLSALDYELAKMETPH